MYEESGRELSATVNGMAQVVLARGGWSSATRINRATAVSGQTWTSGRWLQEPGVAVAFRG